VDQQQHAAGVEAKRACGGVVFDFFNGLELGEVVAQADGAERGIVLCWRDAVLREAVGG